MRLICFYCGKSVSNEVPETTIIRAACECPECIEKFSAKLAALPTAAIKFGKRPIDPNVELVERGAVLALFEKRPSIISPAIDAGPQLTEPVPPMRDE